MSHGARHRATWRSHGAGYTFKTCGGIEPRICGQTGFRRIGNFQKRFSSNRHISPLYSRRNFRTKTQPPPPFSKNTFTVVSAEFVIFRSYEDEKKREIVRDTPVCLADYTDISNVKYVEMYSNYIAQYNALASICRHFRSVFGTRRGSFNGFDVTRNASQINDVI